MSRLQFASTIVILSSILAGLFGVALGASPEAMNTIATKRTYSRAHSLGDSYKFSPRDGWHTINVTDLGYKYHGSAMEKRSSKPAKANKSVVGSTLKDVFSNTWKGLKAIGSPESVVVTWYTGHDLQNPSCWSQSGWAPTDASFVCALTLEGWTTRPKCFKFLELCNGPGKCVFVRVVDTCAGCAKGSKHVDLTVAAFKALAPLESGIISVQLREATEPDSWIVDLWGPK